LFWRAFSPTLSTSGNGSAAIFMLLLHGLLYALLYALGLYALLGIVTAVAFVSFGVTQVLPYSMTIGARVLVLPGAAALWPYVLVRWLKSRRPA
jgi:hypothetical protein